MVNYVFPKVDLPKIGKSNFSLDKSHFTSFAPGLAKVVYSKDVLPGDKFTIDFSAAIESMPMVSPMYGRWKARWAFFFEPYSNIYGWMDNNTRRSTEAIIKSKLLTFMLPLGTFNVENRDEFEEYGFSSDSALIYDTTFKAFVNSARVSTGSLFSDLGFPVGFNGFVTSVTYQDIENSSLYSFRNFDGSTLDEETQDLLDSFLSDTNGRISVPTDITISNQPLHAVKALAYLDIIRNYFVNNQEGRVPYVSFDRTYDNSNPIATVSLKALDYIFIHVRSISPDQYSIDKKLSDYFTSALSGYVSEFNEARAFLLDWEKTYAVPNGGNFLVPYSMDLNRGLIGVDTDNFQSFMTTDEQGRISVTQMYMQNKLQELINILDVTRGRFSDWLNGLWSVNIKGDIDRPVYLGSQTTFIKTKDIVSPSTTAGSVAGQQTGFSVGATNLAKKIHFTSDQYGCLMCVFTMVPEVSYSTGFAREDLKTQFMDIYNPRMAQIGYQDVASKVLSTQLEKTTDYIFKTQDFSDLANPVVNDRRVYLWYVSGDNSISPLFRVDRLPLEFNPDTIVGRQVAWAEYMSDIDTTRGLFSFGQSLEYWALTRRYFRNSNTRSTIELDTDVEHGTFRSLVIYDSEQVADYSTYVYPSEWNTLFADTAPDAENFRMWINFDVFAKRAIPSRTLPHI